MAKKNSKNTRRRGSNGKCAITVTLEETLNGTVLPFRLIYAGKTRRSLPAVKFPVGYSLSRNEKHWSNEVKTILLLNEIIAPYIHERARFT